MKTKKLDAVTLLLSDARGQYIPRDFISDDYGQSVNIETCTIWHIKPEDAEDLLDPENEFYWDTWENVINRSFAEIDGDRYTLYSYNDLWAICYGRMTDEEKNSFELED